MTVKDKKTNKIETIVDKTSNSYLITQSKLTDKGINCSNWFTDRDFKDRFIIITNT
jgi:hypothetical protein